jgi:hypothetical protein
MAIFKTARLKIKRADEHIADVDRQITDLRSPELQRITHEINPQTGDQFLHYDFKNPLPLDDLALVIGDAIHNLKTAADHGWHTLTALIPALASNKYSRFPIDTSKSQLESRLRGVKIDTLHPALFRFVVDDLRPYSEGGDSFLCAIHNLDIRDKHKLLVPLARVTAVVDAVLETETGESTRGASWSTIRETLPITIPIPAKAKAKIKEYGHLAFEVIFDQGSPVQGVAVSNTLHHFRQVTLSVIEAMEAFFQRHA